MHNEQPLAGTNTDLWGGSLDRFCLPSWDDIPDMGLYMDQTIRLVRQYMGILSPDEGEAFITAAAVNNYVRKKLMPEPVHRRYYRIHIVYLLMICSLKQCVSLSMLRSILPADLAAEKVRDVYASFVRRFQQALHYLNTEVSAYIGTIFRGDCAEEKKDKTTDLIIASAVVGGFARILAEKLLFLQEGSDAENQKVTG